MDSTLELAVEGLGVHLLIDGPPRRGKTSVLNVAERRALALGVLPVRVDLVPLLFDADTYLFSSLFEAVLIALQPFCRFEPTSSVLARRSKHSDESDAPTIDLPAFETMERRNISPPLLFNDLDHAVSLSREAGFKGIAFFIDNGHHLEHASHATLETLNLLLQADGSWTLLLGGDSGVYDTLADHSHVLASRFERITLQKLQFAQRAVRTLIANSGREEALSKVKITTLFDLWQIARKGEPYWLKFAASMIWDRPNGDFVLEPETIRKVVQAQIDEGVEIEKLDEALAQIDRCEQMPDELVVSAGRLAPYEAMTVSEYVLARRAEQLAKGELVESDLAASISSTDHTMEELVQTGLLEKREDRFRVPGDIAFRVYLRYEAARRTDSPVASAFGHGSYGTASAPLWLERLANEMPTVDGSRGPIATYLAASDPESASELGKPFNALQEGVDEENPVKIAGADFIPLALVADVDQEERPDKAQLTYVGIVWSVGADPEFSLELKRVACGWLRWAEQGATDVSCASAVQRWLEEHDDELTEHRLRPLEVVAGTVGGTVAEQTVALLSPFTMQTVVLHLFGQEKQALALDYLTNIVAAFEKGKESKRAPWTYKVITLDTYVRLGFIAGLLKRVDVALPALRRALELAAEDDFGREQEPLIYSNLAFARSLKGEFAAAADLAHRAVDIVEEVGHGSPVYLLLHLPTPPTWAPPSVSWSTGTVQDAQIASTIRMQARAYEALAGKYDRDEFARAVGTLSRAGTAAARICGWTLLTRFDDASAAVKEFEAALSGDCEEEEIVKVELQFARDSAS